MTHRHPIDRIVAVLLLAVALGSGCAPPTQPSPTTPPAVPTAVAASKPTAAPTAAAAKPAEVGQPAAKRPTTPEEIFVYNGPDRQQILEEGARREGKILWYASLIINERARPLAEEFRKTYPFVNFDIVRLDSNALVARVIEEYRANRHDVDLIEGSYPAAVGLSEAKLLAKLWSPMLDGIPRESWDPNGTYYADRENPLVLLYNTDLIPEAEAPKTFDDLLEPKYKGKMSMQDSSQATQYFGAMLQLKGEDFLRKLAQQDITLHSSSGRGVADLVVAGEVPITFPVSIAHAQLLEGRGAPVKWAPLENSPTVAGYAAALIRPPHPHATALFIDFLLSDRGQEAMVRTEIGAVRRGIKNPYPDFPKFFVDQSVPQEKYAEQYKRWTDLFKKLMVRQP